MALLSTADGRLSALYRQITIVLVRGFIAQIRRPRQADDDRPAGAFRLLIGLLGVAARQLNLLPSARRIALIRRFSSLLGL
jgi:hypothetical protein